MRTRRMILVVGTHRMDLRDRRGAPSIRCDLAFTYPTSTKSFAFTNNSRSRVRRSSALIAEMSKRRGSIYREGGSSEDD